jgi:hypothetical protein
MGLRISTAEQTFIEYGAMSERTQAERQLVVARRTIAQLTKSLEVRRRDNEALRRQIAALEFARDIALRSAVVAWCPPPKTS